MGSANTKSAELTPEELALVKNSWADVMKNPEANSHHILKVFLDKYDYYSKFEKFQGTPVAELPDHPVFKRHALAVFKGIDNIVQSADNLVEAEDKLKALGKLHQKRPVGPLEFEHLRDTVLEIFENDLKLSQEGLDAWRKIVDLAYKSVFQGLES